MQSTERIATFPMTLSDKKLINLLQALLNAVFHTVQHLSSSDDAPSLRTAKFLFRYCN